MTSRWRGVLVLATAFLVGSLMPEHFPWQPVTASPADVRGSDNVPVTGYRNRAGSFMLWSSGRITKTDGTPVNGAMDYTAAPSPYPSPTALPGQVVGSGNVATGVMPDGSATYIVFADGSVRKPNNNLASAAPLDQRVVWGFVAAGPSYGQGSGDWTIRKNLNGTFHLTFDPPFTTTPAVVTGGNSGAYRLYNVSATGLDLYDSGGNAPDDKVPFTFVASGK